MDPEFGFMGGVPELHPWDAPRALAWSMGTPLRNSSEALAKPALISGEPVKRRGVGAQSIVFYSI